MSMRILVGFLLALGCGGGSTAEVGPIPDDVYRRFGLDPFYKKYLDAGGLPIVSSDQVPDEALHAAAALADRMLEKRADVRAALIEAKVRIAIMAPTEMTTDIPEHRDLTPKDYWDRRARGLGATPARPACSCGAENLLGLPGDRYKGESIFIHEFSHTFHQMGLNRIDKTFEPRLKRLYADAMKKKLWDKTYAATNFVEYWAEGVQCYFDANREVKPANGIHNEVNTRAELAAYDPGLAALIAEAFRESAWRWTQPSPAR